MHSFVIYFSQSSPRVPVFFSRRFAQSGGVCVIKTPPDDSHALSFIKEKMPFESVVPHG